MNERLKSPTADKQSNIRRRILLFLADIPFIALTGAVAEYRLHRRALDELDRKSELTIL
ncbi:MAG: hypothetical protein LBD35_05835 [Prevotellaceae bacterium]|nr:hypothetical protein [Prevotellaceae bacterium]